MAMYYLTFFVKKLNYAQMSRKNLPKNSHALAATLAKKNGVSSHFFYSATLHIAKVL